MKCAKCGAELKKRCLYCSVCGQEAQMVNGYSVFGEDYLKALLTDATSKRYIVEETETRRKSRDTIKRKNRLSVDCFRLRCQWLSSLQIGAIAYVRYQNNNSYDYQIEMAEKLNWWI